MIESSTIATADAQRFQFIVSAEPAVVFAGLAARCVATLCDECTIDIIENGETTYRIHYPNEPDAGPSANAKHKQIERVQFGSSGRTGDGDSELDRADAGGLEIDIFEGTAEFTWHVDAPTADVRAMLHVLVEHAVRTVAWQRSEDQAREASSKVEHLTNALETSRYIGAATGILMNLHKVTQDDAFELLRVVSQRANRKLRDLALEVIETGWLDPSLHREPARALPGH